MKENIEKILYSTIKKIFEIPVIFAYPNAPRPEKPYIVISFISSNTIGQREVIHMTGDDFYIRRYYAFNYSIIFIGTGSISRAEKLISLFNLECFQEIFSVENISINVMREIRNISMELETGFEERASIDLIVNTYESIVDNIGYIGEAKISGEAESGIKDYDILI